MHFLKRNLFSTCLIGSLLLASGFAYADHPREKERKEHRKEKKVEAHHHTNKKQHKHKTHHKDKKHYHHKAHYYDKKHYHHKRHYHKPKLVVVTPRKRTYHHIHISRPYGHAYYGYGHYHHDHDAFKWLAFTAITLKLLDNLNEHAQREHEAAQIKATTAPVGESITWHTENATGSVVATKEGTDRNGQVCREFQQTVTIGGETEQAYGTACLQQDGNWKIIN